MVNGTNHTVDTALKTFLAGGIAGCCAKSAVAPMDRVKLLKQAHNRHYHGLGIFATHAHVVRLEGVVGLYKGNGTQMIRIFPYAAVQFLSYEYYSKILHASSMNSHIAQFLSGSFAGFTAVTVTYPLDMIRARLAFQVTGEHVYSGIIHTLQSIWHGEGGVRGLYRGIVPTFLGMAPYAGLSFYGFEKLKAAVLKFWPKLLGRADEKDPGHLALTIPAKLLCGGLAGAFAQTISYPLDVVRRRIQLSILLPDSHIYHRGFVHTLVHVYTQDGIKHGLYRGLTINYLRVVPIVSVSFCTFETVKQILGLNTGIRR